MTRFFESITEAEEMELRSLLQIKGFRQTEEQQARQKALVARLSDDDYFGLGCGCERCLSHLRMKASDREAR